MAVTFLTAVIQTVMTVLAVVMSFKVGKADKYWRRYLWAFVVLGTLGVGLSLVEGFQQDRDQEHIVGEITGGDSFPLVTPLFAIPIGARDEFGLTVSTYGKYSLRELRYRMMTGAPPYTIPGPEELQRLAMGLPNAFTQDTFLGTVFAGTGQTIKDRITPRSTGETDIYTFHFSALNGRTSQTLEVRKLNNAWSLRRKVVNERDNVLFEEDWNNERIK